MKIAFFHNLPSGGAKRAVYNFVKYLTKQGHSIEVFIPATANEKFLPLSDYANKVHVFPIKLTLKGIVKSVTNYYQPLKSYNFSISDLEETHLEIAKRINCSNYDVVFVEQDQFTFSPFILKFLTTHHVYYCAQPYRREAIVEKVSQNFRNQPDSNYLKKLWQGYIKRKIQQIDKKNASFAQLILTNSYFTRESIVRDFGMNAFVSYLGIDTDIFYTLNEERENYVISVGSMHPHKGFDFIIKSLNKIDKKLRPKLVIVSNSEDYQWKSYIERLAKELGVDMLIKVMVNDNELLLLYNKAKLCLYAPYLEPFGLVPLEATACGTPVIAVKEGGVRESIVDGINGYLVDRDEDAFAQKVSSLLVDDVQRARISQNGVDLIKKTWNSAEATKRLVNYFKKITCK